LNKKNKIFYLLLYSKMGIGDWGLGIGDWGFGVGGQNPKPKPQNPKPQTPKKQKKIII